MQIRCYVDNKHLKKSAGLSSLYTLGTSVVSDSTIIHFTWIQNA